MNCVLCSKEILPDVIGWDGGQNAAPIAEGQCCETCEDTKVVPARLINLGMSRKAAYAAARELSEAKKQHVELYKARN